MKSIYNYLRFGFLSNDYTLEDINSLLKYKKDFANYTTDKKTLFSKILVSMLSRQEIKVDTLEIEGYSQTLFQRGLESELFLGKDMELIYPFFYAYYALKNDKYDEERYELFIQWLKADFEKNEYFNAVISRETFKFFVKYFKQKEKEFISKYNYLLPTSSTKRNKIITKVST